MLSMLTTILDLLGALAVVAALAFAAAIWWAPAGLLVAGAGLLGVSWLVSYRAGAAARAAVRRAALRGGAA